MDAGVNYWRDTSVDPNGRTAGSEEAGTGIREEVGGISGEGTGESTEAGTELSVAKSAEAASGTDKVITSCSDGSGVSSVPIDIAAATWLADATPRETGASTSTTHDTGNHSGRLSKEASPTDISKSAAPVLSSHVSIADDGAAATNVPGSVAASWIEAAIVGEWNVIDPRRVVGTITREAILGVYNKDRCVDGTGLGDMQATTPCTDGIGTVGYRLDDTGTTPEEGSDIATGICWNNIEDANTVTSNVNSTVTSRSCCIKCSNTSGEKSSSKGSVEEHSSTSCCSWS